MFEFFEAISMLSGLAGFGALILTGLACWKLHLMERNLALLIGTIAAGLTILISCVFWLPFLLHWLLPASGAFDWLYTVEGLWNALEVGFYTADVALTLSLARWFFLLDKQQSSPSGVSSPPA